MHLRVLHAVKSPKFFACGGLSALASLVPGPRECGALHAPSPKMFVCGGLSALASLVPGPRERGALRAPSPRERGALRAPSPKNSPPAHASMVRFAHQMIRRHF